MPNRSARRWLQCVFVLFCLLVFVDIARSFLIHRSIARATRPIATVDLRDLQQIRPELFEPRRITINAPVAPAWSRVVTPPLPPFAIIETDAVLARTGDGRVLRLFPYGRSNIGPFSSVEFQSTTSVPVTVALLPIRFRLLSKRPTADLDSSRRQIHKE
jgi:hypothetical protein